MFHFLLDPPMTSPSQSTPTSSSLCCSVYSSLPRPLRKHDSCLAVLPQSLLSHFEGENVSDQFDGLLFPGALVETFLCDKLTYPSTVSNINWAACAVGSVLRCTTSLRKRTAAADTSSPFLRGGPIAVPTPLWSFLKYALR